MQLALAYDRRIASRIMEFGTTGLLWNLALVRYDRQTETLWSRFTGQGIVGELTGVELDAFPVATVPWAVWRDAHPEGLVLSRDTGFDRDGEALGVPLVTLQQRRVVAAELAGTELVFF